VTGTHLARKRLKMWTIHFFSFHGGKFFRSEISSGWPCDSHHGQR
jgi:hypothetical protein